MYGSARSGQLWFAATLILLPASGSLAGAWAAWRAGMHPVAVSGPLVAGLAMLTVAAIFLLELEWGKIWPIFLILGGIGALLPSLLSRRDRLPREEDVVSRG